MSEKISLDSSAIKNIWSIAKLFCTFAPLLKIYNAAK